MLRHRLIFIRHGETEWNAQGRLQGQHDVPINPRGRDQAAAAGRSAKRWLAARGEPPNGTIDFVASPLQRTRETMELVRLNLDLPPQPYGLDDRLKELSFGQWEGLTWADVKNRDPIRLRARKADRWSFVPPGGESYAMLTERVAVWLPSVDRETVVVAHGGVARALMHLLAGLSGDEACHVEIHQGRVLVFEGGACGWI